MDKEYIVIKTWSLGDLCIEKVIWDSEVKPEPELQSFAGMDAPNLDFLNIRKEEVKC